LSLINFENTGKDMEICACWDWKKKSL